MAHAGDILEHPVTGERIQWRQVADDTAGTLLQADIWIKPGGFIAAAHIHPGQDEHFEILAGTATFIMDGSERAAEVGASFTVPAGHPHIWWNSGTDQIHALVEFRPALRTEVFFETFFGLAKDGKVNAKGLPNLLQLAVILREFAPEIRLAKPPRAMQPLVFAPLALIGRLVGYRASYPSYSSKELGAWTRT